MPFPTPPAIVQQAQPTLMSEMLKRAATENATMVDPGAPDISPNPKGPGNLAKGVYMGGAAADIASTAYFQSHPKLGIEEKNPLINWAPKGAQLPIGVGMEAATYFLGNKLLKNHPTLLKTLLMGAGIAHGGLAANNMRLIAGAQQGLK